MTKKGELESPCGTFTVGKGTTTVRLNAPYHLKEYTGWVVVVSGTKKPLLRTRDRLTVAGRPLAPVEEPGPYGATRPASTNAACVTGIVLARNASHASA